MGVATALQIDHYYRKVITGSAGSTQETSSQELL